ncbi:MAG: class I SAM-dependent methyltransferase [Rhodospirillales bacterium]|nr:class I SAM-dependent methyltransferase [Rhodospirillales bacterium]
MSKDGPLLDKAYDRKTKDEVVGLYREWAETYDDELEENSYVGPERGAAVFAEHINDRKARIIDVGCGTGLVGGFLTAHGYSAIDGLDISSEMLAVARGKGVYEDLFEADLTTTIDVPDATYDAAISVGTFTHNHVGPDGLDEVLRIVKPGGFASISVNADAYVADGYRAKFDSLVSNGICAIIKERDEDYIIARGIRSRIVVLKRN